MKYKAFIDKITVYLPEQIEENKWNRLTKKTGIYQRHLSAENELASDLAQKAAERMFGLGVEKENIDFILLCTQSPDYILPTTACILQDKLHLNKNAGALDFNLGCSGYVYGLSLAKGLIESGQAACILLLTAETYSKYIHPQDQTVRPLFGDAATATLIVRKKSDEEGIRGMVFGSDGSGHKHLIVPVGAGREPYSRSEMKKVQDDFGNVRTNSNLYMNGAAIMDFALEVVPRTVNAVLNKCGMKKSEIDYYVFHQANQFILRYLQEKCDLLEYPYWNDVGEYGNTVSNSIPIALLDMLQKNRDKQMKNVLLAGFGVGLSWAGCIVNLELANL